MKKTVAELIEMIDKGELLHEQSTQRAFIYNDINTTVNEHTVTKAGAVINSIVEKNIQLPALYFWHNTETGKTHIHDGKQRLLSIYHFIKQDVAVTTVIGHNEICSVSALGPANKRKLMNYTFDIVERTGTSAEEEESFFLINTSAENLTDYECMRGLLYGEYLTGFEAALEMICSTTDNVKKVGRGEQAIHILYTINGVDSIVKDGSRAEAYDKLKDKIRKMRDHYFDADSYKMKDILTVYGHLTKAVNNFGLEKALYIAKYIVDEGMDADPIIILYQQTANDDNDIKKWDIATHKTFIDTFVSKGVVLDGRRYFTDAMKSIVYTNSPVCSYIDKTTRLQCLESSYKSLVATHIKPWCKGGRTTVDNCKLLCKNHIIKDGGNR